MKFIFTYDLEDNRPNNNHPKRHPDITRKVLDFLSEHQVKGTFFVVGEVADDCPELIKQIAAAGHEIAFHSHNHTPLTYDNPQNFRAKTIYYKKLLEDLVSQEVVGYRAPVFSLTPNTLWAAEILPEIGFTYSSSVLGAKNPLFGFPNAPTRPFVYSSGLVEFPTPLLDLKLLKVPALGGIYLRYLPIFLAEKLLKQDENAVIWSYCHPYDFDKDEKFFVFKNTSFIVSFLLWLNRARTYKKFAHLFKYITNERLVDLLKDSSFCASLPALAKDLQFGVSIA